MSKFGEIRECYELIQCNYPLSAQLTLCFEEYILMPDSDWHKAAEEAVSIVAFHNVPHEADELCAHKMRMKGLLDLSNIDLNPIVQKIWNAAVTAHPAGSEHFQGLANSAISALESYPVFETVMLCDYTNKVMNLYDAILAIIESARWATALNMVQPHLAIQTIEKLKRIGIVVHAPVIEPLKATDAQLAFFTKVFPKEYGDWRGRLSTKKFGI